MDINHLPKPIYIAHRGLKSRFPENTLLAFKGALDAGASMIELDVTLSKDRHLVVIHDDTLNRTTNGAGKVNRLTLSALTRLDAGSWFDPRFGNERLPTLAQVLALAKDHLLVNVEIKPEAFDPNAGGDSVERQVIDLMHQQEMIERVLISSFHWPVLKNLRTLSKEVALGLLTEGAADSRLFDWCRRINAFSWHPDYRHLTLSQVEQAHRMGVHVFPYTVNGKMDTRAMLEMGVDGLIVDDPGQMTRKGRSQA